MYSVNKRYVNEIIIQKSKFICIIEPINSVNDIKEILKRIKLEYKDATHYCYAYIMKDLQKYSDDGEPSGTAGNPILNVLKSKNLENVIAVVVRYFGGIKLGAGGLLRAYTKSVTECLSVSSIIEKQIGIVLDISISYENLNYLYKIIDEKFVREKIYDENINLTINIPIVNYKLIKEELEKLCILLKEKGSIYI